MAINPKLRTELAKYVKLGQKVTYVMRNDEGDKSTMTDPANLLEKAVASNKLEILQAIYDVSSDNKFNGAPFTVSIIKNKFMVTNTKTAESGTVTFDIKPTLITITDDLTKLTTQIELNKVIEKEKGEIKPLKDQIIDAAKSSKNDSDLLNTIKNVLNLK